MKANLSVIVILYFVKGTFSTIISAPENIIDFPGSKLILNCRSSRAVSNAEINWVFLQYGTNYNATVVSGCAPADSNFSVISVAVGACNLVINNLDYRFAGQYTCQNGADPPVSANVGVIDPPATSRMVIDGCITPLPLGAELTCSAQADPVANYTWLDPNSTVSEGTKVKLNYLGRQLNYTCVATNSLGSAEKSCIVSVLEYVKSDSTTAQNFSFRALLLLGVAIGYVNKMIAVL